MEIIIMISLLALLCVLAVIIIILTLQTKSKAGISDELKNRIAVFDSTINRIDAAMRGEFARSREESAKTARDDREEQSRALKSFEESFSQNVKYFNDRLRQQYEDMAKRQDAMRQRIEEQLKEIREENTKKLDEMRKTVDENLKDTVEKRFNDSFKLISERLEKVHQGLGEMQQLASGVGDLKKVLTNVKTRGTFGEIQLGNILGQMLSPNQFEAQVRVKASSDERVDYVVKLPDKNSEDKALLLPIDSKFPMEDYSRLIEAYEKNLSEAEIKPAVTSFENAVKKCAKDIHDKYISPPSTTDYAVMYVPTESLYAEIVRRETLQEYIQRNFRITVAGPTNLMALLNSYQMVFRSLVIEKRSKEVWEILGAVKNEFKKFGGVIDSVKKRLDSAAKDIDSMGTRTRAIERSLRSVEELPEGKSAALITEADIRKEVEELTDFSGEEEPDAADEDNNLWTYQD